MAGNRNWRRSLSKRMPPTPVDTTIPPAKATLADVTSAAAIIQAALDQAESDIDDVAAVVDDLPLTNLANIDPQMFLANIDVSAAAPSAVDLDALGRASIESGTNFFVKSGGVILRITYEDLLSKIAADLGLSP